MKKVKMLMCAVLMSASLAGCTGTSDSASEENAKQFVTWVYTTDENERYTEFLNNAVSGDEDSMNECLDAFYADVKNLVDEEYLDTLTENRIPMKYDELYLDDHVTVDDVTLSKDGDSYAYTVNAHYGSGDLTFTGTVGFNEEKKIISFDGAKKS